MDQHNKWLGEAIEKAAKHLPEGNMIMITIENGGYCVDLVGHKPDEVTFNIDGGDGIISDINEALCIANGFTS